MILDVVAAFAAGYLLGGVPAAMWISRLAGSDIFRIGSRNMGAMNTARNVGFIAGIAVFAADVGKGALAVILGGWMATVVGRADPLGMALLAGVGAVAGHAWSPYVRFRGGKGLAAIFGASLPVAPWAGVTTLLLLIALILLSKRSEASAVASLILLPFVSASLAIRFFAWPPEQVALVTLAFAVMSLVSVVKHRQAWRERRAVTTGGAEPNRGGSGGPPGAR